VAAADDHHVVGAAAGDGFTHEPIVKPAGPPSDWRVLAPGVQPAPVLETGGKAVDSQILHL